MEMVAEQRKSINDIAFSDSMTLLLFPEKKTEKFVEAYMRHLCQKYYVAFEKILRPQKITRFLINF